MYEQIEADHSYHEKYFINVNINKVSVMDETICGLKVST